MERTALDEGIDRFNRVLVATGRAARAVEALEAADARRMIPKGVRNEHWQEIDRHHTAEEDAARLATLKGLPGGRAVVEAIVSTRALREAIDAARAHLPALASLVNNTMLPPIEHWTTLADGELRELRSALVAGQGKNTSPSCLPWVGQGVVVALEKAYRPITRRFESLKSLRFTRERGRPAGTVTSTAGTVPSGERHGGPTHGPSAGEGTGLGHRDPALEWEELLHAVHRAVAEDPGGFADAVRWLETDYAEAQVRSRRAAVDAGDENQPASAHQIVGLPQGRDVRLWRLGAALVDLRTSPPDLSRTALEDPGPLARRVLLLVCLLTDRAVGGYGLRTDMADVPYGERWAITPEPLQRGQDIWPQLVRRALSLHGQGAWAKQRGRAGSPGNAAAPKSAATEPRICQDVVLEFINAASGVLPVHVEGAIAELKGEVRRPNLPSGSESRRRVQHRVQIELPRLLSEAMVLAGDEGLRHTLHLRLQRVLDIAQELEESLDGVTPERTVNLEKRALKAGPWIAVEGRLRKAVQEVWPLLDLSVQGARDSVAESKAAAAFDLDALVERVVAAQATRIGPGAPAAAEPQGSERVKPKKIFLRVAIRKYQIAETAIRDAVRKGELSDLRPRSAAKNSALILDENEIAARWLPKAT